MLLTWLRLVFVRRSVYVFDTFLYGTNVPVNVIFDLDFDFDIVSLLSLAVTSQHYNTFIFGVSPRCHDRGGPKHHNGGASSNAEGSKSPADSIRLI